MPWVKQQPMNGSNILKMKGELSGQPSTSWSRTLIAQLKNIIHQDPILTKIAEKVWIFTCSCHTILMEDIRMHYNSGKLMPRLLIDDYKLQWLSTCETIFQISLQMMKCGFTVKMFKQTNKPPTGRVLLHLTPRKNDRCSHKWNQWYVLFFFWSPAHLVL